LVPKTSRRPGDVSSAMAENASLSLEKPAPPAPKCPKPVKGAKPVKCGPTVASKAVDKPVSKGNSSGKNAASQHKSASTGLAKSAKNSNSANPSKKGAAKNP